MPPELIRWLVCTTIGMREALVRHGRVRREVLDACTAEAEREYDERMDEQDLQRAADAGVLFKDAPFVARELTVPPDVEAFRKSVIAPVGAMKESTGAMLRAYAEPPPPERTPV